MVGVVQTGEAYYAEEAELMLISDGCGEIIVLTFLRACKGQDR
ncbi:hypothetical protein [Mucilaginibacter sp. SMC90]|nr:hypothetical protein [Mucilaginibacter sp. SMC90]